MCQPIKSIKFKTLINKIKKNLKSSEEVLIWYMCLKTENCYLKTFVKIRVSKKLHKNI